MHPVPSHCAKASQRHFRDIDSESFKGGKRSIALLVLLIFLFSAQSAFPQTPDKLKAQGYVNDFANVLSSTARERLTALCTEVSRKPKRRSQS